ncbi:hypothetical protein ACAW74_27200 [Fibrella sp. WM1]|uniref:hypothetical protein n=1 Tax=Fibrella musci TaxID=3242485 RepID=UPI0035224827
METNAYQDAGPATAFQQILALLNLTAPPVDPLQTSAARQVLSADPAQSLIAPTTVTLATTDEQAALLAFFGQTGPLEENGPVELTTFTANNVTVKAGEPLQIMPTDHSPVLVNIDTLTLEQGAQIQCFTAVVFTVGTLIKQ